MSTRRRAFRSLLILLLAVNSVAAASAPAEIIELDEADVYIEYNATDDEYVVVFFWDTDGWKSMAVRGPNGTKAKPKPVLNIKAKGNARKQGMTEGFFESAELDLEESTVEEFFALFPEGEYSFRGKGLEKGEQLVGTTDFTHALPDDPGNVFPDDGDMLNAANPITITFDPVTEDLDGDPITIAFYTVVVEYESPISEEDLVFSMVLEGTEMNPEVTIPQQFLIDETEYTIEIIVHEESGNRTICELDFETV